MYATVTLANGVKTIQLTPYTQKFAVMYTAVAVPLTGSIGLGTISGTVGVTKALSVVTQTVPSS